MVQLRVRRSVFGRLAATSPPKAFRTNLYRRSAASLLGLMTEIVVCSKSTLQIRSSWPTPFQKAQLQNRGEFDEKLDLDTERSRPIRFAPIVQVCNADYAHIDRPALPHR